MSDESQSFFHIPVLLKEAVEILVTKPDGIYVDGTIGGGGHSEEILRRLNKNGRLFGFDKDEEAINFCREKFKTELERGGRSRLELFNACFSLACSITKGKGRWTGFLLDLGVSSRQLDEGCRGFSYRFDASLDLRFSQVGSTAEELVNSLAENELTSIFLKFGEEPFSRKIARKIIERRKFKPIKTTFELAQIVEDVVPKPILKKSLSRIFQALRIVVNDELAVLEKGLNSALGCMENGGRIVVISYHSLEDRIVKNFFKKYSLEAFKGEEFETKLNILTKKPKRPNVEEIKSNPRSRSAKLRAAEVIRNLYKN
ncbi:MAG: 16S rRNA (cytosine(1402)-N(4))-methyltransferase RsmH [Ignavibacteria bacterium]|nr:16S rRNA (cytosine(1402)-N(4))-methyltransferase RsmH [Ignavibacteria bacterium]